MNFKKISTLALAMTMMFSTGSLRTVRAEEITPQENGVYTADVSMLKDGTESELSMCAGFFAAKADVEIKGDNAIITTYVVNPVPAFPKEDNGNYDEVLKNVKASIAGKEYTATVGKNLIDKVFDKGGMSGTIIGTSYPCNPIELTVPKTSLNNTHIDLSAFVNVVMKTNVDFDMKLANYVKDTSSTTPEDSNKSENKTSNVTATVAPNMSTYTVTVPETIAMGELSITEDTSKEFEVSVDLIKGNDGKKVVVSSATEGKLSTEGSEIKLTNSFGTQEFAESGTKTGTLKVKAEDVKKAKAETYSGTVTFEISTK